ncbi:hypothetical protein JF55_00890 [Pseudomonas sp. 1-7]|nr:hypothetical protein JF55_00890 [Pseudomonas sp. 1-7]
MQRNRLVSPLPLAGDDCMDAGGRATQDAKAEWSGERAAKRPTLSPALSLLLMKRAWAREHDRMA